MLEIPTVRGMRATKVHPEAEQEEFAVALVSFFERTMRASSSSSSSSPRPLRQSGSRAR